MNRASYIPHLLCEKINDILVGDLALADLSNVDSLAILQKLLEVDGSGSGLNADRLDNHEADEFAFVDLSNVSSNNLTALLDQIDVDAHTLDSHPLNDFMLKEDYLDAQGRVALASHALQADEATHATQADEASNTSTLEGHPASDFALASHAHDDLYLNKSNDDPYTPTSPYNPATKRYVDDLIAAKGDMFMDVYDPDNDGSVEQADDALTLDGHQPVTSPTPSSIPITDSDGYLNDFIDWDSLSLFVRKDGDTMTGDLHVLASLLARLLMLESAEGFGVEFEPTAPNTLRLKGIDDPAECHLLLTSNDYEVWHSGNDGPGSGLNADLLDDLEASQLVRKDIADSVANEFLVRRGYSPDIGGRIYLQSPAETDLTSNTTVEAFSNYFRVYAIKSNGMLAGYKFDIEQLEDGLHDVGDMLRSVYDPDKDGVVELADNAINALTLDGHNVTYFAKADHTHALGDLSNVYLGTAQPLEEGQSLVFDGSGWVNDFIPGVLYERDYDSDGDGVIDVSSHAYTADDSDLWEGSAKYVSSDEPHPDVGEDGDFWFQYDCSKGAK